MECKNEHVPECLTTVLCCNRNNLGSSIHFVDSSLTSTLLYAVQHGMYSCQFFLGGNMGTKRSKLDKDDIKCAKKVLKRFPINVITHMPYTYNLCGSVKSLAWNGDKTQDKKSHIMLGAMQYELDTLSQVGGKCVVHIGSYPDKKKGIEAIANTINKLDFSSIPNQKKLLLENGSGSKNGNKLGSNIDELQQIYSLVKNKDNIGFCIDTCHIHAAGEYDFGKIDDTNNFLKEFDSKIGLEKLELIHLNDSMTKFESYKDRHQMIGQGTIWGKDIDPLVYFMDKTKDIPTVLETYVSDYKVIQSI